MTREAELSDLWHIVIFTVAGQANHVGLSLPGYGLADLSLLGARIVSWDSSSLPKGERIYFQILVPRPACARKHLQCPGLLMLPIIKQEKACRGWHLTKEAPDYVRKFHSVRSTDLQDMNCVEWIVFGLELGGVKLPDNVLTPTELLNWCRKQCENKSSKLLNVEEQ